MKLSTKVSIFLLTTICCTAMWLSCSIDSENTLTKDELSTILGELVTIERMNISDTLKIILIKEQLTKNDITVKNIQKQIERKKNDTEYWLRIFEKVDAILKEKKQKD